MAAYIFPSVLDRVSVFLALCRFCYLLCFRICDICYLSERGEYFPADLSYYLLSNPCYKTVKKANPKAEKADPEQEASEEVPKPVEDGPLPLRKLLVWPVIVSVANYGTLAFLEIAFWAIQPLFLSTPIEFGGLGQTPASIGLILGLSGMGNGIFQALFFAKIVRRWGTKRTFIVGLSSLIVMFILFPIINMIARQSGTSTLVWVLVSIQAFITFLVELSYGE